MGQNFIRDYVGTAAPAVQAARKYRAAATGRVDVTSSSKQISETYADLIGQNSPVSELEVFCNRPSKASIHRTRHYPAVRLSYDGDGYGLMQIDELNETECREILSRASAARLGCSLNDQPHIVPVGMAYEADYIYVFATFGQKIEWMRANPRVCVQIDELKSQSDWVSVIANGEYQELPEPQFELERAHARRLLESRHHWWLNAMAERRIRLRDEEIKPLFFRIRVSSVTGLRGTEAA